MQVVRRLGELHVEKARLKALRLVAFTGAVFPREWVAPYNEAVTSDLLEFSFHARRVNQICELEGVNFGSIKVFQVTIYENDPGDWVEHYGWALDRLMHAREFIFGNFHAHHRPILNWSVSNLIPLYVKVATDRREMATISLFGLAEYYLNRVVAAVKQKFPDWQF